jgi:anti-sigma factor RsiW
MASARERDTHVQVQLGACILGGLSAADDAAVREHLDRCALCRAEHDDLACVPGWLDLLAEPEAGGGRDLAVGTGDDDRPAGSNSRPSGRVGLDGSQQ